MEEEREHSQHARAERGTKPERVNNSVDVGGDWCSDVHRRALMH